jgi:TolB-like protein
VGVVAAAKPRGRSTAIDRRAALDRRPAISQSLGRPRNFLNDLIAEAMIGDLSRLTDLFVISRPSAPFGDRL